MIQHDRLVELSLEGGERACEQQDRVSPEKGADAGDGRRGAAQRAGQLPGRLFKCLNCGIDLPAGLQQAEKLPQTLFTPAYKAEAGEHDENISFDKVVELVGEKLATRVRDIAIQIYKRAATYALERGIIIADTKFEFGTDEQGRLYIIDEMLTPDSSRFWPVDGYAVGISPPSFDKQFVRDYLESLDWDKTAPGPKIPDEILEKTRLKYQEAFDRLTRD